MILANLKEKGKMPMREKTNRRMVLAVLVLLVAAFVFSCGTAVEKPVGRWQTEISDEDLGTVLLVYRFTEEGEIFLEQGDTDEVPFSIPFGTYSVSGEKMTIVSDGAAKEFTFSVKEKILTLSAEGESDMVFEKI